MLHFLSRRFVFFLFTYLLSSLTIFFLLRVLPGDPARVIAGGREATAEQIAEIRDELGLNAALPEQYVTWLGDFLRGEWGDTIAFRGANNRDLIAVRSVNSRPPRPRRAPVVRYHCHSFWALSPGSAKTNCPTFSSRYLRCRSSAYPSS